jgi:hypothetical protein
LRVVKRPFERLQTNVGAEAPSVQFGSQKGDPVVVVVNLGVQLRDLSARAHASNSSTKIAITAPARSGSSVPT